MIKRILVVLDADGDTPVATRYAIDIARRHGAELTGLALVDTGSIEASTRGGGIGSMYLAENLKDELTKEARAVAHKLTSAFRESASEAGVVARAQTDNGAPLHRIAEDTKYHDLLVLGKVPHLFYSHPYQQTLTIGALLKETVGAALVVTESYAPVRRVLVAHDDSPQSALALRSLVHLRPFGSEVKIDIVNVHKQKRSAESGHVLEKARAYLRIHGMEANAVSIQSDDPFGAIVESATQYGADLLVLGIHVVAPLTKLAFGSTTASFLDSVPVPLWLGS